MKGQVTAPVSQASALALSVEDTAVASCSSNWARAKKGAGEVVAVWFRDQRGCNGSGC